MVLQGEAGRIQESKAVVWRSRVVIAQIIMTNSIPVIGVWFFDWQALRPIFFYWLDGLLALWGLGVVAALVTCSEEPFRASGAKRWLFKAGVIGLMLIILAIPSVFTAMYVLGSFHSGAAATLHDMFASADIWFWILFVIGSYAWQTIGELLWKPDLTIKSSGKERAGLFIHRTLMMGLLVFWGKYGQPPRLALAIYVLSVACLYTFIQLYPERYLQLIGFKTKTGVL